jgi:hypothetical protein
LVSQKTEGSIPAGIQSETANPASEQHPLRTAYQLAEERVARENVIATSTSKPPTGEVPTEVPEKTVVSDTAMETIPGAKTEAADQAATSSSEHSTDHSSPTEAANIKQSELEQIEALRESLATMPDDTDEQKKAKVIAGRQIEIMQLLASKTGDRLNNPSRLQRLRGKGVGVEPRATLPKRVKSKDLAEFDKALKTVRSIYGEGKSKAELHVEQRRALDLYYYGKSAGLTIEEADRIAKNKSVAARVKIMQDAATENGQPISEEEARTRAAAEWLERQDRKGRLTKALEFLALILLGAAAEQFLDKLG